MTSNVPEPVQPGDLVGLHFPTSIAKHPHPGLIIQIYDTAACDRLASRRGLRPDDDDLLCLMLMISHEPPPRGEAAEYIPAAHRAGTSLDPNGDLFISYRHFDAALNPQRSLVIGSVRSAYLGRMAEAAWRHYRAQFRDVQNFRKGRSFHMPKGLWT